MRTPTRIVLQYWLFYYDNPLLLPPTPFGTFWQSHEGDWEVVNVVLDADEQPLEAAYSQHSSGRRQAWAAVGSAPPGARTPSSTWPSDRTRTTSRRAHRRSERCRSTRAWIPPAVRPILPMLPFLQVVDQVLEGPASGPARQRPRPRTIRGSKAQPVVDVRWALGRVGVLLHADPLGPIPAGAAAVGLAPVSPANHGNWNVATILAWPPA